MVCYKMFYIQGIVFIRIRWLVRFMTDNDHWKSLTALYCISSLDSNETHFVWTFIKISICISDEDFFRNIRRMPLFILCQKYTCMMSPFVLRLLPHLRQFLAWLTGRRMMTVTGHQMICLVLWNNSNYTLL